MQKLEELLRWAKQVKADSQSTGLVRTETREVGEFITIQRMVDMYEILNGLAALRPAAGMTGETE